MSFNKIPMSFNTEKKFKKGDRVVYVGNALKHLKNSPGTIYGFSKNLTEALVILDFPIGKTKQMFLYVCNLEHVNKILKVKDWLKLKYSTDIPEN